MAILLGILKIIGIIVLAVIGIVLLTLLYLLLLPVSLKMYAANDKEWSFRVKLLGFLRFFQIQAEYLSGELIWSVRAFWGRMILFPREAKEEKEESDEKYEQQSAVTREGCVTDRPLKDEKAQKPLQERGQRDLTKAVKKRETSEKQKVKSDRGDTVLAGRKIRNNDIGSLADEQKRALRFLLQELIWYLKKIKPTMTEADAVYSLGDPAWTGELTGILSLWPSAYGKRVRLGPDFESDDPYFKGYVQLESRFYAIHLVRIFLRIYFNKDCRKLFDF